jgi:Skp family chaperone for outer membrane proteins
MKKLLISASLAASLVLPSAAAQAQAIPGAVIAVVDLEKVTSDCNACKTASAALRSQATALQSRQQALATPLQTEQKSIQTAIDALKGKEPDAALQARVKAFQTKAQSSEQELAGQQSQIQRNQAYIQKQIADKLGPIYKQVMTRRVANLLLSSDATLATSSTVDVTNDILAALNTALPSISTTAPASQQPQGR